MKNQRWFPFVGLSTCLVFVMVSFITFGVFPPSADAADTKKVMWLSLPQGSKTYATMVTFTQLVNKHTDLECVVEPVPSPIAEIGLVNKGEGDVLNFAYDGMYNAYKGWGGAPGYDVGFKYFKGKPHLNMRLLLGGDWQFWTIYTHPGTGIKTIADLKGKRFAGFVPGWLISNYATAMLQAYGLDPKKDVKMKTFPRTSIGSKALLDGLVDAVLDVPTGRPSREMEAKKGIRILSVDPSKIDFVKRVSPVAQIVDTPSYVAGYSKQGPIPVIGVRNNLMANKNLSDYAAYNIVKAILENAEELRRIEARYVNYRPDQAIVPNFMIPYHPGVIRYYKEKGIWKAEHDALQAKLMKENEELVKANK